MSATSPLVTAKFGHTTLDLNRNSGGLGNAAAILAPEDGKKDGLRSTLLLILSILYQYYQFLKVRREAVFKIWINNVKLSIVAHLTEKYKHIVSHSKNKLFNTMSLNRSGTLCSNSSL